MNKKIIEIVNDDDKRQYLPLLLLGDEQESMIDRYLSRGRLFVIDNNGCTIAVAVVTIETNDVCELKNIAVAPEFQRQGIGQEMIEYMCNLYAPLCSTMLVGTGESLATLSFYRNCGFEYSHTLPNFFTDNYDHPIIEEGKPLCDMIYLRRHL